MKIAAPVPAFLVVFLAAALSPHVILGQASTVPANRGFATVARMLSVSCLGCHAWAGSWEGTADPARVAAANPAKSPLFMRVATDEMPPSGAKLDRDSKLIMRAWIAAGASPTDAPVGQGGLPYPSASNDPPPPIPEPCPCGLD